MAKKKKKNMDLKWEVARELGLLGKILESGWGSLSSRESGRIGGVLARKLQQRGERELPGGRRNNST